MGTIGEATSPDTIPGYDKAYWHAKTPQECLAAALLLTSSNEVSQKITGTKTVCKFQTSTDWEAFKKSRRR